MKNIYSRNNLCKHHIPYYGAKTTINHVRLPPCHTYLNPIDFVWGDTKGELVHNSSELSLDGKQKMQKIFENFIVEKWKKCCAHTHKNKEHYWIMDCIIDNVVEKIIFLWEEIQIK